MPAFDDEFIDYNDSRFTKKDICEYHTVVRCTAVETADKLGWNRLPDKNYVMGMELILAGVALVFYKNPDADIAPAVEAGKAEAAAIADEHEALVKSLGIEVPA